MARKNLTAVNESNPEVSGVSEDALKEVCSSYIANKAEADKYSKLAKSDNEEIKKQFMALKMTSCSTDTGTVKLSEQVTETFRENDLIQYLKDHKVADGIVKMKEYVDMDALESAIYHETISKEIIAGMKDCKDKKVVQKLLIKKGD